MKTVTDLFFLLILLFPPPGLGGWEDSVAYIDSLLSQGRKVAVLIIDMQEWFAIDFPGTYSPDTPLSSWEGSINTQGIIEQEARLLEHLSLKEGVYIINVTFMNSGATLPELLEHMQGNQHLSRFVKSTESAFEKIAVPESASKKEPGELIFGKLKQTLAQKGIKDIFLTGCFDGACIYRTAKGALKEGFSVTVDNEMNIPVRKSEMQGLSQENYETAMEKAWKRLAIKYPQLKLINKDYDTSKRCTIL